MDKYPFFTVTSLINFYKHCNPARQIYVDMLARNQERERDPDDPFNGDPRPFSDDPQLLWNWCRKAIFEGLAWFGASEQECFHERYLKERSIAEEKSESIEEIIEALAVKFRRTTRTIRNWLDDVVAQIEHEAITRGLMPPKESEKHQ